MMTVDVRGQLWRAGAQVRAPFEIHFTEIGRTVV
jgi:hypothetical protein